MSIIVPVYKEAEQITDFLRALQVHDIDTLLEVIIVDPLGDTHAAIPDSLKGWEKLKLVSTDSQGRALQMNVGASEATGDVLLFLHADTRLPRNALFSLVDLLKKEKCDAGAFNLSYDDTRFRFTFIGWLASLRSRVTRNPYGDQGFFIRRKVFEELMGFHPLPLFEDVDICQRMKKRGYKIGFVSDAVVTSARRYQQCWICVSVQNIVLALLYYCGVNPEKLAKIYYKKKTND